MQPKSENDNYMYYPELRDPDILYPDPAQPHTPVDKVEDRD